MPNPYPLELRTRVVTVYESGAGTYETVAQQFIIGSATVKRWVAKLRCKGHVQPDKKGGGTPSQIAVPELEAIVARLHDATARRDHRGVQPRAPWPRSAPRLQHP